MFKKMVGKVKEFFLNLGKKFAKTFKRTKKSVMSHKLATLTVMQLKDKWNMSSYTRKRDIVFKVIFQIIIFAVATGFMYLLMYLSVAKLGIFFSSKIPVTAMVVLIFVLTLFEGISILVGLTNALYFSKDNCVLITYPVKADYLFLSKIFVYYLDALKKSCGLLLPTIFAFGIIYGYAVYYYLWVILLMLIYIAFIVLVCAILSIPTYFVMKFLRKYRIFQGIFAIAVLGFVIWGAVALINVIPSNINLIKTYAKFSLNINNFLKWFSNTFKVSSWITAMFCGVRKGMSLKIMSWYSLIVPVCLIGAIVLLTFVNMKISKPFYTKMISATSHGNSNSDKDKENKKFSKYHSVYHYELLRIIRNEKQLVSTIVTAVIVPLIMLLANKVYGAISLSLFGMKLTSMFNYFFVLILVLSHNLTSAYIYSKDGPSWNVNKTMPVDPRKSLIARLLYNAVASVIIIIPGVLIYTTKNDQITPFSVVLIIVSLVLFSIFHSLLSASYDYSNSKDKDKADIGSEIVSKHENVSLVYAIVITIAVVLFIFILNQTTISLPHLKLSTRVYLRVTLLGTLLVVFEMFMFRKKIKATYQEN